MPPPQVLRPPKPGELGCSRQESPFDSPDLAVPRTALQARLSAFELSLPEDRQADSVYVVVNRPGVPEKHRTASPTKKLPVTSIEI